MPVPETEHDWIAESGQVQINRITCAASGPDFAVYLIDCAHKWAEVSSYSSGCVINLVCTERTPGDWDHDAMPTRVRLPARYAEWSMILDWSRYTICVALYRMQESSIVWMRDDGKEAADVRTESAADVSEERQPGNSQN